MKTEADPNQSALCFIRNIVNSEEHLNDSSVSRFIDVNSNSSVDQEAKQVLEHLKNTGNGELNVDPKLLKLRDVIAQGGTRQLDMLVRSLLRRHLEYDSHFVGLFAACIFFLPS